MNYDIVAGMDNTTLNNLINQLYSSLYPKLFKETIPVNEFGFASIGIDLQKSPTADFNTAQEIFSHYNNIFNNAHDPIIANLPNHIKGKLLGTAAAASFTLSASQLNL